MDPHLRISTGRTKDWEAREAQAEKDVRNGQWPGAWRPEDRASESSKNGNGRSEHDMPASGGETDVSKDGEA